MTENKTQKNDIDAFLKVPKKRALFLRYKASKLVFILSAILFFANAYMVGARFSIWESGWLIEKARVFFPFSYVIFVVSICVFSYFYIRLKLYERKNAKMLSYIAFAVLAIIGIIFLITFILRIPQLWN